MVFLLKSSTPPTAGPSGLLPVEFHNASAPERFLPHGHLAGRQESSDQLICFFGAGACPVLLQQLQFYRINPEEVAG